MISNWSWIQGSSRFVLIKVGSESLVFQYFHTKFKNAIQLHGWNGLIVKIHITIKTYQKLSIPELSKQSANFIEGYSKIGCRFKKHLQLKPYKMWFICNIHFTSPIILTFYTKHGSITTWDLFQYKDLLSRYGNFHDKENIVVRPS